jgi:hypothetical protein
MKDILLKYRFDDRADRSVYAVLRKTHCDTCGNHHFQPVGQQIRFDLDGNFRIKVDNVITFDITQDEVDD